MNKFVTLIISVFVLFISCDNRQTKSLLQDVETYIQERPDSALRVLRKVDTLTLNTKSLRARYSLLFAMALDKNYIDTMDVSVVMPAVNYYRRHGNPNERLKAYFYLGRIYLNDKRYDRAAVAYSLAEAEAAKSDDAVQKGILYMNFSYLYNLVHNKEKQLEYAQRGLESYKEGGDTSHINLAYGNIALIYHSKRDWHKADSIYRIGIDKARYDTLMETNLLSNYAKMKMIQPVQDPQGAISLLRTKVLEYSKPLSIMDYGVYAYALDKIGDNAASDKILYKLENLDEKKKADVLIWMYRIYYDRGDYKKSIDNLIAAKDDNITVLDSLLKVPVSQGLQVHYQTMMDESRTRMHRILIVSIVVLMLVFLLFIVLMLNQRIRRMKERENDERMVRLLEDANRVLAQENSKLKFKTCEYELEKKKASLSFASIYKDKFATIGELCKIFRDSKDRNDKKDVIYYRVEHLISSISDDDKLFARFESQINQDLDDIIIHLKEDLGHLDKKDERFICYLIAGLDSRTISALMNLSISNVYTKKSRLRERIKKIDSPYKNEYLYLI